MLQPPWVNDRTFHQNVLTQARFLIPARIPHMNDWMTYRELEIFANVRIQTNNVDILDSLIFACLTV